MLVMLLKILNDMTIYTLLERERERERERPGYLSESVPYTWSPLPPFICCTFILEI